MIDWIWVVKWRDKHGDEHTEQFSYSKEDAEWFVKLHQWERGEHPRIVHERVIDEEE